MGLFANRNKPPPTPHEGKKEAVPRRGDQLASRRGRVMPTRGSCACAASVAVSHHFGSSGLTMKLPLILLRADRGVIHRRRSKLLIGL